MSGRREALFLLAASRPLPASATPGMRSSAGAWAFPAHAQRFSSSRHSCA